VQAADADAVVDRAGTDADLQELGSRDPAGLSRRGCRDPFV
jgi:hypothetical protein